MPRTITFPIMGQISILATIILFAIVLLGTVFFFAIFGSSLSLMVYVIPLVVLSVLGYQIVTILPTWVLTATFHANNTVEFQTLLGRKTVPVAALYRLIAKQYRRPHRRVQRIAWLLCAQGKFSFNGDRDNAPFWEFLTEVQQRNPRVQMDDYFLA